MAVLGLVFALLEGGVKLGGVLMALFLAFQAWHFVTNDFAPTRDIACNIGLKSSCVVVKKGISLDSLRPRPVYTAPDLSTLSLTPTPGVTPSPTPRRSPTLSDLMRSPTPSDPK